MRDQTCFRSRACDHGPVRRLDPVRFRGRPCPSADSAGRLPLRPSAAAGTVPGPGSPAVDRRSRRAGARAERRPAGRSHRPADCRTTASRSRAAAGRRRSSRRSRRAAQTNPPQDIFGGDQPAITNENLNSQLGVQQLLPWGGAQLHGLLEHRPRHDQQHLQQLQSAAQLDGRVQLHAAAAAQLQDRRHAPAGAGVSSKNREISDVQLQQSIAVTTRNVKNAYWDLVYAINNLAVQRQSLQLAQQSFRDNRARVEIGTMAPLDIVQAEAEVAQREEGVILAEAAISRAEDRAARADLQSDRSARVLEHAPRACRSSDLPAGHRRRRRRGAQRARGAHRPCGHAQADRSERHHHPLLPQPVDARRQRARQLQRHRAGRHAVRLRPGLPTAGPGPDAARLLAAHLATRSRRTSRPGRCSCR